MNEAIEKYLKENYEHLSEEKVSELAKSIETYMIEYAIPDIVSDFS